MCTHYRENKQPITDAFRRMADALSEAGRKMIRLGLDGVMYASLGAECQYFSDEELDVYKRQVFIWWIR